MIFSTHTSKKREIHNFNIFLLCTYFILIVFSSCQKDIIIELKTNDKRLLVDGEFTNDSVIHSIRLYCSGSLITGAPQAVISGASIYLTDKKDTFYYKESIDTLGLYHTLSKCRGIGGKTFFLSISNVDIDNDGAKDSFTANGLMPVPVAFDSLVSKRGLNGDNEMAVINWAYYSIKYNGPEYIYKYSLLNNRNDHGTITDRLGSGEFTRFEAEYKLPMVGNPLSVIKYRSYLSISSSATKGDTISFNIYNFTKSQFEFLKQFDNNTSGDSFLDNLYDQLKVPANVSTNIEPSNKAAGYFFVYSKSRISKVFKE